MKRWPVVVAIVAAVVFVALAGCTVKQGFDAWIAKQGFTVKHEKIPCAIYPDACGAMGRTDIVNRVIYIDDARVAQNQAAQNVIDPSVDVAKQIYYHEWSHVADWKAGFVEGVGTLQFEHAAQCGMELVTGRAYSFFFPAVYWDCPDADLAKTRWIWTAMGIIPVGAT